MASNDVDRIYASLDRLEKRINELGKEENILKRIKDLEEDMEEVSLAIDAMDSLAIALSKLNPLKWISGR